MAAQAILAFFLTAALGAESLVASALSRPLRVAGTLDGDSVEIEVRDLDPEPAEAALSSAWGALSTAGADIESMLSQTARQPTPPDAATLALLARAESFCLWSDGAVSPLGGAVRRLWENATALPTAEALELATASARCRHLQVDAKAGVVRLEAGSQLDLELFARGWAIDRAAERMQSLGARNFYIRHGSVASARGTGPAGVGWPMPLPAGASPSEQPGSILLRDQAAAIVAAFDRPLQIAGERFSRSIDLRNGRPATGVATVVAVSELAVDAEPLARAMVVLGASGGQLRLGVLRPRPAVLWLLGTPETGASVVTTFNWSAVRKQ